MQTSLVFITTSGTTGTQESEQEATDKLLELGALNSSDGRFVPDLNSAASESCTSVSASLSKPYDLILELSDSIRCEDMHRCSS